MLAEPDQCQSSSQADNFGHPVEHTVTLNGTHKETAFSDKVIVSLVITTETDRLGDSMQANARLRTTISRTLIDAGVAEGEINTSKFSSSPQFGWFGGKPKSFEVVNRLSIGITDEAHLQLIATLTDENDEVVLAGMKYEHTAKESFEDKVKVTALDKTLVQKAVLEERLGVVLVPIGFNEQMVLPHETRDFEMDGFFANSRTRESDSVLAAPPQQTFDEITYRATIYVTFRILQE